METLISDLSELPLRIETSAARVRDLEELVRNERTLRDQLIVRAVDEAGIPQRNVAKFAGMSQPQILRILAKSSS